jgi:hypothetical protein
MAAVDFAVTVASTAVEGSTVEAVSMEAADFMEVEADSTVVEAATEAIGKEIGH